MKQAALWQTSSQGPSEEIYQRSEYNNSKTHTLLVNCGGFFVDFLMESGLMIWVLGSTAFASFVPLDFVDAFDDLGIVRC
jgi:hypothetical protein